MTARRKKYVPPSPTSLWSWSDDRKASRAHIAEAVRHAMWEKAEIATKSDEWYASACKISQDWRDKARALSVHALARQHLEYWRYRAHMPGAYGMPNTGDRPARARWEQFA